MKSDDNWKQEVIEKDMMTIMEKLGKGKDVIISRFYKIKSLGEDKLLKIEMIAELYNLLKEFGINFDDFSKGEKLFDNDIKHLGLKNVQAFFTIHPDGDREYLLVKDSKPFHASQRAEDIGSYIDMLAVAEKYEK